MSGVLNAALIGSYPVAGGATSYRYFRWIRDSSAGSRAIVEEASISDDAGSTIYPQSIGNMSGASTPSPLVASSSTDLSGSTPAWEAFDGSTGAISAWQSSTGEEVGCWLQIDLGSGNEISPNWFRLICNSSTTLFPSGRLLASNTGAFSGEEVTLVSWSGNTNTTQTVTW